MTFAGIDGADKIASLMNKFRAETPAEFGGVKVAKVEDFSLQTETDTTTGAVTPMTLPKANVVKYWLADGSWVAVRPSGTEPKIKFYLEIKGTMKSASEYDALDAKSSEKVAAIKKSLNLD